MATATTDTLTTEAFRLMLEDLADMAEQELEVEDAADRGWMVPPDQDLVVTDPSTGTTYLVTVRKVD